MLARIRQPPKFLSIIVTLLLTSSLSLEPVMATPLGNPAKSQTNMFKEQAMADAGVPFIASRTEAKALVLRAESPHQQFTAPSWQTVLAEANRLDDTLRPYTQVSMRQLLERLREKLPPDQFTKLIEDRGHGAMHLMEVVEVAMRLAVASAQSNPDLNYDIVLLGAFFHDVTSSAQNKGHEETGAALAEEIARTLGYSEHQIRLVGDAVRFHNEEHILLQRDIELQIVRDADTLVEGLNLERIVWVSINQYKRPFYNLALKLAKRMTVLASDDPDIVDVPANDALMYLLRNVTKDLDAHHYLTQAAKEAVSRPELLERNRAQLLELAETHDHDHLAAIERTIQDVMDSYWSRKATNVTSAIKSYFNTIGAAYQNRVPTGHLGSELRADGTISTDDLFFWIGDVIKNALDEQTIGPIALDVRSDGAGHIVVTVTNRGAIDYDGLKRILLSGEKGNLWHTPNGLYIYGVQHHPFEGESLVTATEMDQLPPEELPFIGRLSRKIPRRDDITRKSGSIHLRSFERDHEPYTTATITLPQFGAHKPFSWKDLLLAPLDPSLPDRPGHSVLARGSSGGDPDFTIQQLAGLARDHKINLANERVVSLGTGHNPDEPLAFAKHVPEASEIIGVDVFGEHIREVGNSIVMHEPHLAGKIRLYHADARDLKELASDSVALLEAVGLVLPENGLSAVIEIIRIMKPGALANLYLDFFDMKFGFQEEAQAIQKVFSLTGDLYKWTTQEGDRTITAIFRKSSGAPDNTARGFETEPATHPPSPIDASA